MTVLDAANHGVVLVSVFWLDANQECVTVGNLHQIGEKTITIVQLPSHNYDNQKSLHTSIPISDILKVEFLEPEPKNYNE